MLKNGKGTWLKGLGEFRNRGWIPNKIKEELARAGATAYRLKITLAGSEPPIWRQVLVPGDVNLAGLHQVIQYVMGWSDSHLHMFHAGKLHFGPRTPGRDEVRNERQVILRDIAPRAGAKFFYEYDMGDSWVHEIKVEKITRLESGFQKPECLAGARACPPEDCGGIYGYEELLEALRDPRHRNHAELAEWAGEDFDPEVFNVAQANRDMGRKKP